MRSADDIQLIYEQFQASEPYVREDAIELLDNLLNPKIKKKIASIMDEDAFLGIPDVKNQGRIDVDSVLKQSLNDSSHWMNLVGVLLVVRLRMNSRVDDLKTMVSRSLPASAAAAQWALLELEHS